MRAIILPLFALGFHASVSAVTLEEAQSAVAAGNCDQAVEALNTLAANKDAAAMNQLGAMHLVGKCVEKSNESAKTWFEKAAAEGSLRAQKMLERLNK
ncbi:SEL1-like repeat protein [Corallincola platygyrae]|uniref:SEL1-like repeat protein n=1 Tax=Corallincola platygyrae TaxID=1193278 RepID=A0ABW4XN69_9GAMM